MKESKQTVAITMEDDRVIVIEVYPEIAPKTVANFVKLVNEGFYDGLTFHRIAKDFVIQGGDPKGNGQGGSDEKIFGEFSLNGFQNKLSHTRGVVSMARLANDTNSATSQFFIVLTDQSRSLDGSYAAFGKVVEGMDVVDSLALLPVKNIQTGAPVNPPVMKTVKVVE